MKKLYATRFYGILRSVFLMIDPARVNAGNKPYRLFRLPFLLLWLFFSLQALNAQVSFPEVESNDNPNDPGVHLIYQYSRMTGSISATDNDYWKIAKRPGATGQANLTIRRISGSPLPPVYLEKRSGSYDGALISTQLVHSGSNASGFYNQGVPINYDGGDFYYLLRMGNGASVGGYTYDLFGFSPHTCTTGPSEASSLSTTSTANSITLDAINGSTANRFLVKINTVNSFTGTPAEGQTLPVAEGLAYSGSGEQTVYVSNVNSNTPDVTITGLNPSTDYFFKVYGYTDCTGYFKINTGTVLTARTCGDPAATATGLSVTAENDAQIRINSITHASPSSVAYVVKMNTQNSFTAPVDGGALPVANHTYTGGEQVVYAGTSAAPTQLISGLTGDVTYYFKVYTASACGGQFYFESTGFDATATPTCGITGTVQGITTYHLQNTFHQYRVNGAADANGFLVYINTTNSFTLPVSGLPLPAGAPVTASNNYTGPGQQLVNRVNAASFTVSNGGFSGNTEYFYRILPFKLCTNGTANYATPYEFSIITCGVSDNQASAPVTSGLTDTSLRLESFTPAAVAASGSATGYVIKINSANSFTPLAPSGSLPAASAAYTTGEQVIYTGTSASPNIDLTGLSANTTYYFTVYAYSNCNGVNYFQQVGHLFSRHTKDNVTITLANLNPGYTGSALPPTIQSITRTVGGAVASPTPQVNLSYEGTNGTSYGPSTEAPVERGEYTVTASVDAGNQSFQGTNTATLTIGLGTANLSSFVDFEVPVSGGDETLNVTSAPGIGVSFELITSNTEASLNGNILTPGNVRGTETLRVTVADANYNATTKDVTLTIGNANPVITWADPADIPFSKALDATELNATANVPGTFSYAYGQFLFPVFSGQTRFFSPGTYQLRATFTPADPTSYNTVSKTVSITATKVDLTLKADDIIWAQGEADPALTYTLVSGELVSGNVMFLPLTRAAGTTPGDYDIMIDNTAVPNPPLYNGFFGGLSCTGGICITDTPYLDEEEESFLIAANRNANYNITFLPGTFTIVNKTLANVNLTAADLTQTYDGTPKAVTVSGVTETGSGNPVAPTPAVNFSYKGADRNGASYGPSATPPVNAGNYTVTASIDGADPAYVGFTQTAFTINPAPITSFNAVNLNHVADGSPRSVTVTSTPEGASVKPTYFGSGGTVYPQSQTAPSAPGQYFVRAGAAELTDPNYSYTGSDAFWTMVIYEKSPLSIVLDPASLTSTYDGTPKTITISSITELISGNPLDQANWPVINITYDGNATGPVDATFESGPIYVEVTVDPADPNYSGSVNDEIEVNQALSNLVVPAEEVFIFDGTPKVSSASNTGVLGEDLGLNVEYAPTGTSSFQTTPPTAIGTYQVRAFYDDAFDQYNMNYQETQASGTLIIRDKLTITQAEVDFTAPASLVYDATPKTYMLAVTGGLDPALMVSDLEVTYVGRNTTSYASNSTAPTAAGDYTVTATVKAGSASYTGSVTLDFTITPVPLTITADAVSKVYGDADPAFTFQLTSGSLLSGDLITGVLTRDVGETVGSYAISQGTVTAGGNYSLGFVSAALTIDKKDLTVTPMATTAVYGEVGRDDHPVTYSGFVNGEDESVLSGNNPGLLQVLLIGTDSFYPVSPTAHTGGVSILSPETQVSAANYHLIFETADLTVTPRPIAITADSRTIIYGEDANTGNTAVLEETDQVNHKGLAPSETISDFSGSLGFSNISQTNAGTHTGVIVPSGLTNANYTISYIPADLTINQLAIEVTADAGTKTYGDADPAFTFQITQGSLVGGDQFSGTLERLSGEAVGNYIINQGTLSAGVNYVLSYQSSDLSITKRNIEVTADNKFKIVGTSEPALTYTLTSGSLAFSDVLTGTLARETGEEIGFYAINQGTLTAGNNYNLNFVQGNFEVTPKMLQVIQFDALADVTYGDGSFDLTGSASSGLALTYSSSDPAVATILGNRVTILAAGTTNIIASQAGDAVTEAAENQIQPLVVQPRTIEVAADPQSKTYGDSDPGLTYQVTSGSFINGENFTGSLSRVNGESVGTYAIEQGTLTGGANYSLVFSGSDLTINTRTIELTADPQTKVYGEGDPSLTYQMTQGNLVFSDLISGDLSRAGGESVGKYTIEQGSITAGANYSLSFVSDDLTISQREITITADAGQSKTYGDAEPALAFSVTSGALQFADAFTGALSREAGENVGSYAIIRNTLTAGLNYNLSYVGSDFNIGQRSITLTADAKSKAFGADDPEFTYQATAGSLVNGDQVSGKQERVSGETAGTYPINQGTLSAGMNYDLTYNPADLTIDPVPALHFNGLLGSDYDYVEVADNGSLDFTTEFTFETWVTFDQVNRVNDGYDWQFIFAKSRYNESYGLMLLTDGPRKILRFYHAGFGTGFTDYIWNSVTIDTWHHVAVTLNGSKSAILINGAEVASQTGSGSLVPNNNPFRLGAGGPANNVRDPYPLQGALDEVRVWNKARSATQISDKMRNQLTGNESGLVLYYNFNEGTVNGDNTGITTVPDHSQANNNGSLNGHVLTGMMGNYVDASGNGVLPATPQTITFDLLEAKNYGDGTFNLSATATSGLPVTFTSSDPGVATISGNTVTIVGAGKTTITAMQEGSSEFEAAPEVSRELDVSPRVLEVTANAANKAYGDEDPLFTYQVTSGSLLAGDAFSGALARVDGENIGFYPLTQGTLSAGSGYQINLIPGLLTIEKRVLEVSADAASRTYGDVDPPLTYQVVNGSLVNGDVLTGELNRDPGESVGEYTVLQGTLDAGSNYLIEYTSAVFSIHKRVLEISANTANKIYGQSDPALTYQVVNGSLVNGDLLTGGLSRDPGENVGEYAILKNTLDAGVNYLIEYTSANFTIDQRTLEVTADAKVKNTGEADPSFTYQITQGSLVTGDMLTGELSRVAGETAGTYAITRGTLTAGDNYLLSYISADLNVLPVTLGKPVITGISDDTGVSDRDGITNDKNITISGTADPDVRVEVSSQFGPLRSTQADANGDWLLDITDINLFEVQVSLTAEAVDASGNRSVKSDVFVLTPDFTAPAKPVITGISEDTGVSNTDGVTNDRNITISGTAEPNSTVEVSSQFGAIRSTQTDAGGNWLLDITDINLFEIKVNLTAEAVDLAGNRSVKSDVFVLTPDFTAPAKPVITGISDDTGASNSDGVTSDRNITISGTAEPNSTIEVSSQFGSLRSTQTDAGGNWLLDITDINLFEIKVNLTAEAVDLAGNRSARSDVFVLTPDFTGPAKPVITGISDDTGASNSDGITSDRNITISGTAEPNSYVEVSSQFGSLRSTQTDAGGNWLLDITDINLFEIKVNLTAEAVDLAGNRSTKSDVFVLIPDFTAPAKPVITGISDDTGASNSDGVTSDRNVTISGTAEPNSSVEVSSQFGPLRSTQTDAGGNWLLDITDINLFEIKVNLTAEAVDLAGNRSAKSDVFVLTPDFTAPAKPMITGISDDTGASNSDGVTSDKNIIISGTAEANSSVEVSSQYGPLRSTRADANGDWLLDITDINLLEIKVKLTAEAVDLAGNRSVKSDVFVLAPDFTAPGVTIDIANVSAAGYAITALFDEAVSGLTLDEISVTGGSAANLVQNDPMSYSFVVSLSGSTADVNIGAGTAQDIAGNDNTASNLLSLGAPNSGAREGFNNLSNLSKAEQIRLYPNPASTVLTIDLSTLSAGEVDVFLYNASGKPVFSTEAYKAQTLKLDVSNYLSGMYIVQIYDGQQVIRKKVMVRK